MGGTEVMVAALVGAVAGAGAGAAARCVLGRMRRGTEVRAPTCEFLVGAVWAATGTGWAGGVVTGPWLPALLGLGWLGVAAGIVDLRHRRLPDALTLPAVPLALVLLIPLGAGAVTRAGVGVLVAVAAHAALHLAVPRAMGAGDVKLAGSLGAVLAASSWSALLLGAGLAALLTGTAAAVALVRGRAGRGGAVPHGPAMLVAGWVVAAAGAGSG